VHQVHASVLPPTNAPYQQVPENLLNQTTGDQFLQKVDHSPVATACLTTEQKTGYVIILLSGTYV